MSSRKRRLVAAVAATALIGGGATVAAGAAFAADGAAAFSSTEPEPADPPAEPAAPNVKITEWEYNGSEFVEFTNLGDAAVDMTGWSFSDDSATAGDVSLSSAGTVAPGESFILSEASAATFRAEWKLADSVKVVGGNTTNLGRADEINLFDASGARQDTLAYGDESGKGPRTDTASAWPSSEDEIGADNAAAWTRSTVGDLENSWASVSDYIGSPGVSRFGTGSTPDPTDPPEPATPDVKITEWEYKDPEFVEFTNVGTVAVDLSGWSYADSERKPGDVSFANLGTVQPGESFLLTEDSADTFRSQWGLGADVKILGGNSKDNLSSGDEINLYDGSTVVDRLTYSGIGANGVSAVPAGEDVLGANNAAGWTLSAVGDAEQSWRSTTGAVGSPGISRFSSNAGDPGTPPVGVPCQTEAPTGSGAAVAGGVEWPGSRTWNAADTECGFVTSASGQDVSGLDIDPADPTTLWAVKNKNRVYKLHKNDAGPWVPATDNGWGTSDPAAPAGKATVFANGGGQPDTEGITTTGDSLFVTTERDNGNNKVALDSVLRFDPNASGSTLTPTMSWNLTPDFTGGTSPVLSLGNSDDANLGFEGITYVPDNELAGRFLDESTGAMYDPAAYPAHGDGVFFLALEKNGHIYAYVLGEDGSSHRIADIASGMSNIAETQWDADNNRLWAVADNTSAGSAVLLKLGADGAFVSDKVYDRPTGLPDRNLEGFTLLPDSTCVDGQKEVIRSDDGNNDGHSLWSGTIDCDLGIDTEAPTVVIKDGAEYTVGSDGTYEKISFALQDDGEIDKADLNGTVTDLDNAATSSFDAVVRGSLGAVVGENTLKVYDAAGNVTTVTFTLADPHVDSSVPSIGSKDVKNRIKAGAILAVDEGGWTDGTMFSYQWFADGQPIAGATGDTYELTGHERGTRVTVEVTGTLDGFQDVTQRSAAVTVVLHG